MTRKFWLYVADDGPALVKIGVTSNRACREVDLRGEFRALGHTMKRIRYVRTGSDFPLRGEANALREAAITLNRRPSVRHEWFKDFAPDAAFAIVVAAAKEERLADRERAKHVNLASARLRAASVAPSWVRIRESIV